MTNTLPGYDAWKLDTAAMRHRNREQIDMPKEHEHVYTSFVDYDEKTDMATARCECGSTIHFPSQAKNRVSAWSAYPNADGTREVVRVAADENRLENGDKTEDKTNGYP